MQSLATFFEDNKALAYAAVVAGIVVLIFVVAVLYRLLFGRRLHAAGNGRTRQPRLGIVDAYDLDRQRQLVLVRRDNVEHLIMIGGPTDVVVESSIVRTQAAAPAREPGALVGTVSPPGALAGAAVAPALAPVQSPAALPPARSEPTARVDAPLPQRSDPPLGGPDRTLPPRPAPRPIALPDPAAPDAAPVAPQRGEAPARPAPVPRPAALPPRPATPVQESSGDRPAPPRAPLPPRPPASPARAPLPPRPSLASSLPPRPPRPPLPPRPDAEAAGAPAEPRVARGPDPEPGRGEAAPVPPKNIESLESLEEEMAKLLGRPAPRRDG